MSTFWTALEIIFQPWIVTYFLVDDVQSFVSCLHLDWLCNSYTILRQSLGWWHYYLKLLRSMILKQVFSIFLDGQNQISSEQILVCIEYHISLNNSGPYGKCFRICDITECRFYHVDFFVVIFVGFVSCYFVLISL